MQCGRFWLLVAAGLLVQGNALAEGESAQEAGVAFDSFVEGWMGDMAREADRQRDRARFVRPTSDGGQAGAGQGYTYRKVVDGSYETQLKETGKEAAPFVGILNYTEEVYVCTGPGAEDCKLVESSPITEIFPFSDGNWKY